MNKIFKTEGNIITNSFLSSNVYNKSFRLQRYNIVNDIKNNFRGLQYGAGFRYPNGQGKQNIEPCTDTLFEAGLI